MLRLADLAQMTTRLLDKNGLEEEDSAADRSGDAPRQGSLSD